MDDFHGAGTVENKGEFGFHEDLDASWDSRGESQWSGLKSRRGAIHLEPAGPLTRQLNTIPLIRVNRFFRLVVIIAENV